MILERKNPKLYIIHICLCFGEFDVVSRNSLLDLMEYASSLIDEYDHYDFNEIEIIKDKIYNSNDARTIFKIITDIQKLYNNGYDFWISIVRINKKLEFEYIIFNDN